MGAGNFLRFTILASLPFMNFAMFAIVGEDANNLSDVRLQIRAMTGAVPSPLWKTRTLEIGAGSE